MWCSFQFCQHIKTGFTRHLNIQKNKIRLQGIDLIYSFFGIGCFINHFHFRKILQKFS